MLYYNTGTPPCRTPDAIALQLLDCVEEKGEAAKWDLINVLGNQAQFKLWIEDFFILNKVLAERREGRHYFFTKTERGSSSTGSLGAETSSSCSIA